MMKRGQIQHQYEPLMIPADWKGDERRLVIRLTETLDVLFDRLSRMEGRIRALEKAQEE